jgi:hypothetical protein
MHRKWRKRPYIGNVITNCSQGLIRDDACIREVIYGEIQSYAQFVFGIGHNEIRNKIIFLFFEISSEKFCPRLSAKISSCEKDLTCRTVLVSTRNKILDHQKS